MRCATVVILLMGILQGNVQAFVRQAARLTRCVQRPASLIVWGVEDSTIHLGYHRGDCVLLGTACGLRCHECFA
jgi:hypothetical protein